MSVSDIQEAAAERNLDRDPEVRRSQLIDRVLAYHMTTDMDAEARLPDAGDPVVTVSRDLAVDLQRMRTTGAVPQDDAVYGELNEAGLCIYTASVDRIPDDADQVEIRIREALSPFAIDECPDLVIIDSEVYYTPFADLVPGQITNEPEAGFVDSILENGVQKPITVAEVEGDLTVIDGHTRLSAVEVLRGEGVDVPFSTDSIGELTHDQALLRAAELNTQSRQIGGEERRELMRRLKDRMGWRKWTTSSRHQKDWARMMGVSAATISHDFDKMGVRRTDKGDVGGGERTKALVQRQADLKQRKRESATVKTGATYLLEREGIQSHLSEYSAKDVSKILDDVRQAVDSYRQELDSEIGAIDRLLDEGEVADLDEDDLEVRIEEIKAQS